MTALITAAALAGLAGWSATVAAIWTRLGRRSAS
jgi:hypothetical protein